MADQYIGVCCCCWEKRGERSKFLKNVTDTIEDLMKLYIQEGYDRSSGVYPCVICTNCLRNLKHLKTGQNPRSGWQEKVSKVNVFSINIVIFLDTRIYL